MRRLIGRAAVLLGLLGALVPTIGRAIACPFCSATAQTLRQDMASMDVCGLGELIETGEADINGEAQFRLVKVWRGESALGDQKTIKAPYYGPGKSDKRFLLMGVGSDELLWSSPLPISHEMEGYLETVSALPDDGPKRLRFYLGYLQNPDSLMSRDAYEEFAQAPYEDVKQIRDSMDRPQLLEWIKDKSIPPDRKRLYYTLLGVCGQKEDASLLEEFMRSESPEGRLGLDALIACFLTLKGDSGLPAVGELFLSNAKCPYADTYAAVMALRFHGTDGGVIEREKIVKSMRLMLERPEFADLVIPDLARWQDWSQIDRLVKLFIEADEETSWVRVPVVNYLRACPLPEAKAKLEELEKIDPKAVKRAATFFPIPVPNTQATPPATNDSSSVNRPDRGQVVRLPLGARSHQLASSSREIFSDKSFALAARPTIEVNHGVLMVVTVLCLLMLGLMMWMIVNDRRSFPAVKAVVLTQNESANRP